MEEGVQGLQEEQQQLRRVFAGRLLGSADPTLHAPLQQNGHGALPVLAATVRLVNYLEALLLPCEIVPSLVPKNLLHDGSSLTESQ